MRRVILFSIISILSLASWGQKWAPVEGQILTRWAKDVNPENVWPEYPRPQLERQEWKNLNGLWDYAIQAKTKSAPSSFDGEILVPFPVESALSGVKKMVGPDHKIWYRRSFSIPKEWKKQNIILHFEASDWETAVWVNDHKVGVHRGGYDPFKFDITPFLKKGENKLVVSAWDPTDEGYQPLGKQVLKPGGIFYTPVTGIWQTVWLEPVPETYLESVRLVPDIDQEVLVVTANVKNAEAKSQIRARAYYDGKLVSEVTAVANESLQLPVQNPNLWEPGNPSLYDLELEVLAGNKVVDRAKSYFGMRKIALGKDDKGYTRMLLNNEFVFHNGPLDQGYWPDGIYTAPNEEAMRYDLEITQQLGFNMLRKHVKFESRRFYSLCDKMGLLVWQDMPNGDKKIGPQDPDIIRSKESEEQYRFELKKLIDLHYNNPSIVMWVPFNEGWGQFKTAEIVDWVKEMDPSRLVNNASGWTDRKVGDVHDIHNYPEPASPEPEEDRAVVLGEFGGLGLSVKGHMWEDANWGYRNLSSKEELLNKYEEFYTDVWKLMDSKGMSAAVYTQITDVETEANGLMTYDREVIKIDPKLGYRINTNTFVAAPEISPAGGLFNDGDQVELRAAKAVEIRYTLDGSEPTHSSALYQKPIVLHNNVTIKAKAFGASLESRTIERSFSKTNVIRPVYKYSYSKKYDAGGDFALCDKAMGTGAFADGKWQGFNGVDLDVTLELAQSKSLSEIGIRFIQNQENWIFFPENVTISVSEDGEIFNVIKQQDMNLKPSEKKNEVKTVTAALSGQKVKFVRVFAKNIEKCPKWHAGNGGKAWIFTDEVTFK